jgi:murein DD-endopeptidase MepM/ murein hydrolase activator NlpD
MDAATRPGASTGLDPATRLDIASRLGTAAWLDTADHRVSRQNRTALTGAAGPVARIAARPAGKPAAQVASTRWVRPSAGAESSCFCMRWGVMHEGIDLAGPLGSPIVAVGDGVVADAGPAAGFGMWVAIRHANGDYSIYGHMYRYYVRVGEHVRAGQHIADIGANGFSTGPHLHFAIARGSATGPFVDPVPWLAARGVRIGPYNPNA